MKNSDKFLLLLFLFSTFTWSLGNMLFNLPFIVAKTAIIISGGLALLWLIKKALLKKQENKKIK